MMKPPSASIKWFAFNKTLHTSSYNINALSIITDVFEHTLSGVIMPGIKHEHFVRVNCL